MNISVCVHYKILDAHLGPAPHPKRGRVKRKKKEEKTEDETDETDREGCLK